MNVKHINAHFLKSRFIYFVSAFVLIAAAFTSLQAKADDELVFVSGRAAVNAVPDKLSMHLFIEEQNLSVSKAKQIVDAKTDRLLKSIFQFGIDEADVQSYQLDIHPYYENIPDQGNKQNGFMVTRTFKIDLDNWEKFDQLIDKALGLGVTRVGQISTHVSDSYSLYLKALENAVEQARAKAQILAKQAGRKLGKVVEIREQGGYQYVAAEAMSLKSMRSQPGSTDIEANVSVSFELK
ncbi:SIMPL domain-containing protein [Catenovulum sp. 2E275]|uniref:SIMPL domain-containing protein n=1 Tax=Catenovulum sp. 2E275 TaxID=2980497 RepID=UPI0021D33521|nr:SIMPL domain-containing protein [Catenovulum sp. 2E275]MCU4676802.1 SIMPL domain-containing protein [Catenovulum sp. 2E275]